MLGRFGGGGIFTDFRILIPLFVMAMILVLGWHRRHPVHDLANQVMVEEVGRATSGLNGMQGRPAVEEEAQTAPSGGIPLINMDGTEARPTFTAEPALLYAAALGALIAVVGVVGSLVLLRGARAEDDGSEPQLE
jgi:hypothetical protein